MSLALRQSERIPLETRNKIRSAALELGYVPNQVAKSLVSRETRTIGLVLTEISFAPGVVRLAGTLPEWRMDVPRKRLEDILNQLSVAGVPLNLTRVGRFF